MPIPFLYDSEAGVPNDPAEVEARNLYDELKFIQRLTREMDDEADLDAKRAVQLLSHCRKYRLWYGNLAARIANEGVKSDDAAPNFLPWPFVREAGEILGIVEGQFLLKSARWSNPTEMAQDLAGLNDACKAVADKLDGDLLQSLSDDGFTKVVVLKDDQGKPVKDQYGVPVTTDIADKMPKPVDIAAQLSDFRTTRFEEKTAAEVVDAQKA